MVEDSRRVRLFRDQLYHFRGTLLRLLASVHQPAALGLCVVGCAGWYSRVRVYILATCDF